VSPTHRGGFEAVVCVSRRLVEICVRRRPSGEELGEVWRTLRGLPAGWAWRSDVEYTATWLRIEVPSWTPPEEAFEMLAALTKAAEYVVFALCRLERGGGFAPPSAEKEAKYVDKAREEISKALAKARVLGLVI
jgi:hypothetical protein